jgi:hypothetical protein
MTPAVVVAALSSICVKTYFTVFTWRHKYTLLALLALQPADHRFFSE